MAEENKIPADDPANDISKTERELLDDSMTNRLTDDNVDLKRASLDNVDNDGEPLNEDVGVSGSDLDVPGSELDDANEEIGSEDEENNSYSQADTE